MSNKSDVILQDESVDLVGDLNVRDQVDGPNTCSVEADSGTLWSQTLTVGGDPTDKRSRVTIRASVDDHSDDAVLDMFEHLGYGRPVRIPVDSRVTVDGERGEIALGGNGQDGRLVLLNADGTKGFEITSLGKAGTVNDAEVTLADLLEPDGELRQKLRRVRLENQQLKQKLGRLEGEVEQLEGEVEQLEGGMDRKLDSKLQELKRGTISDINRRLNDIENGIPPGR